MVIKRHFICDPISSQCTIKLLDLRCKVQKKIILAFNNSWINVPKSQYFAQFNWASPYTKHYHQVCQQTPTHKMTDKIKLCARIVCFYHLVFINFSFKVAQIGWFLINLLIKHWQLQSNERKPDDKWRQSQTNCRFNFLGKKFSIYSYICNIHAIKCLLSISDFNIWHMRAALCLS